MVLGDTFLAMQFGAEQLTRKIIPQKNKKKCWLHPGSQIMVLLVLISNKGFPFIGKKRQTESLPEKHKLATLTTKEGRAATAALRKRVVKTIPNPH